jgi:cadmium resistance protein CadD (predicted permease)
MSGWRDRSRRNWFGAAVLIAVGVIGLIANFDLLPRELLEQMWKLWPVIPLLIGISILMRRRASGDDRPDPGGH